MANILIVDDTVVVRKILTKMFTDVGHTVVGEAEDGQKAVSAYKKLKPDLVTMDINMPVMNGLDACKEIISEFPDAKIVVLTALGSKHHVIQAFKFGAKHYLVKPVDREKSIAVVNDVLDTSGKNKNNPSDTDNSIKVADKANKEDPRGGSGPKGLAFESEQLDGKVKISIDLVAAESNISVFYATLISSLRKLLFSESKNISFNFRNVTSDNTLIETIAEIIGLTTDAGMNVEVASSNSFIDCLKSKIDSAVVKYIGIG